MRRAAAVIALAAVVLTPMASALAGPGDRFSSPARAAAGSPMWLRSLDQSPCPTASSAQVDRFVSAWVDDPASSSPAGGSQVIGDVRADGSWEVSLSAPAGVSSGATAHYTVRAACIEDDTSSADANPTVLTYEPNALAVTSSGGASSSGSSSSPASSGGSATTTTTEAPDATTSTTAASGDTTTDLSVPGTTSVQSYVDDEATRAAELRAELAASGKRVRTPEQLALVVASLERRAERDGGIPWWSFVLATMLAVGAVVAWGGRRSPSGL